MKHDNRDQQRGQHDQPEQDRKQHEQGRDPREMNKARDRDMGKNRNEEETGKPVQLGKDGQKGGKFEEAAEGEGGGPQLA